MKREAYRRRKLPAFLLRLDELEVLWSRLTARFEPSQKVYSSIDIELPKETLKFDNPAELRQYPHLPAKVTDFTIRLSSQYGPSVSITSSPYEARPKIWTSAEDEAWCAGTIETVFAFLRSYKLWYWWLPRIIFLLAYFLILFAPTAAGLLTPGLKLSIATLVSWGTISVLLCLLWMFHKRLLPAALIRFSDKESFIRRYGGELTLLVAVASLVVAIASLVVTLVGTFKK